MAIEAGVPIVPVAMIGTYEVQPTGTVWPRIRRIKVAYGAPIDTRPYAGQEKDPVVLRAVTNRIMESLQALSGQEYVDIYATKARELLARSEADVADDPGIAERIADAEEEGA